MSDLNKLGFCQKCGVNIPLINELREENERLSGEVGDLKVQLHKTFDDWVQMRDRAIIWHRWPGEKPKNGGWYLTYDAGYEPAVHISIYVGKEKVFSADSPTLTHWAEIPQPEGV
jgi:hypothetical protein